MRAKIQTEPLWEEDPPRQSMDLADEAEPSAQSLTGPSLPQLPGIVGWDGICDIGIPENNPLDRHDDEFDNAFIVDLQEMPHHEALKYIFRGADPADYVAVYERRTGTETSTHDADEERWHRRAALTHSHPDDLYGLLDESQENPLFITLGSFHRSSIRPRPRTPFKATMATATAIHGVAVDLDVGRAASDRKAHVPGARLTQDELSWKFNALVFLGRIPPPHLWVKGTRGCYAIWLFDPPHADIDDVKRKWKILRECYLIPRLRELAVDEKFRSIIQPLKAPGACGRTRYFRVADAATEALPPLATPDWMLSFFRQAPESCDLPEPKERTPRMTRELSPSAEAAASGEKPSWERKRFSVEWCRSRADEMMRVTRHFSGEPNYPRREYMRDLASALKTYHYRHTNINHWYWTACNEIEAHNAELARPLPPEKLKRIIHEANHGVWLDRDAPQGRRTAHRSTKDIVVDMAITENLCEELGLIHLRKPFDQEARARLARDKRLAKEEQSRVAEEQRAIRRAAKALRIPEQDRGATAAKENRMVRMREIDDLRAAIRLPLATSEIEKSLGVHRQTIIRERRKMEAEGEILPEPRRLKRGRKISEKFVTTS